jgi:hypothetical protein
MDVLRPEAISPELVLVTPELRWRAISALWEAEAVPREAEIGPRAEDALRWSLPVQLFLYIGWQAATGAAFGLAAFLVFVALLLLKPLIGG